MMKLFTAAKDRRSRSPGEAVVSLGMVMAGILGNLYDRLGLSNDSWYGPGNTAPGAVHAVRDWILWQASDNWRWPNFNIADSLLVCGAAAHDQVVAVAADQVLDVQADIVALEEHAVVRRHAHDEPLPSWLEADVAASVRAVLRGFGESA